MIDLDDRLRAYAERWRAAQPAPPPPDASALAAPAKNKRRVALGVKQLVPAAALTVAIGAVLIVVVARRGKSTTTVSTGDASLTVAKPPLLSHFPSSTGKIALTSGQSGSVTWTFLAQVNPSDATDAGLCMGFETPNGTTSGCDDPRLMPSLAVYGAWLGDNHDIISLYGVTSAPAARFRVAIPGHPVRTVSALSNKDLPGLRFFATPATPGAGLEVDALSARGSPLLRNDPNRLGPLFSPPPAPTNTAPDSHTVWPLDPQPGLDSAVAVARDFSTRALRLTGNAITPSQDASIRGPTMVTIALPAAQRSLRVLASPRPDGSWVLLQVGDQTSMRGITYLPGGQPTGPVMSILVPTGAANADVTARTGNGLEQIHLSKADLDAGVVHFPPESGTIFDVLIVYHDQQNAAIDAIGEGF